MALSKEDKKFITDTAAGEPGSSDLEPFFDPTTETGFLFNPFSDVPAGFTPQQTLQAQRGAARQTRELEDIRLGRGGRAGPAPKFGVGSLESSSPERLRDKLIGLYEQWTGAFPDRPSLDFVTNQALGGESVFNIRGNVQATPEFKSRFKNMPAGMDIREYDQALVQVNSQALQIAGRPVTDQELALYFAGNGTAVYESFKGGPPPNSEIPPAPPKQEQIVKPAKTEQVLAPDSKIELEEV